MSRVSHILGYVLAAVIALTAQSAAVARTMPDATGQMVLCTGTGPVMVYTDEDGNPTSAPHICPEFSLSLILALDVPELPIAASGAWSRTVGEAHEASRLVVRLAPQRARGPPVLV